MITPFPVPDPLPVPESAGQDDIEDLALDLYQRLADATRHIDEIESRAQSNLIEQERGMRGLIAALAAERFEFGRLAQRLTQELDRLGAQDTLRVVNLHARAWDQRLTRHRIEVRDLTGFPVTEQLLSEVDVEAAVADATITQSEVRQTLVPLILLDGKTIGVAKVVTSVPANREEQQQ